MKINTKITALFAVLGMAMVSCMSEPEAVFEYVPEGQPVTITVDASMDAPSAPDPHAAPADLTINSLRVLVFNSTRNASSPGVLVFNTEIEIDADGQTISWPVAPPNTELETKLNICTGTFDFVFIANEGSGSDSGADITNDLDALMPGTGQISDLNSIMFGEGAFHREEMDEEFNDGSLPIPMMNVVYGVKVYGNDDVDVPGIGRMTGGVWTVELERIGVRLDIELTLSPYQYSQYKNAAPGDMLTLSGIPSGAWLMPRSESNFKLNNSRVVPNLYYAAPDPEQPVQIYFSMILPERVLWAGDDVAANAMTITALGKSGKVSWFEGDNPANPQHFTLPRNTFLHLSATIKEDEIVFTKVIIKDWEGPHNIRLTERGIVLPESGILAPPGVLGVNSVTGELTLRGSVEYKNTEVAPMYGGTGSSEFGDISNETVYVAYFKWGSLIGMGSGPEYDFLSADDVIWAPEEYDVRELMYYIQEWTENGHPTTAWERVPYAGEDADAFPDTDPVAGVGDPCAFADKGYAYDNYIMPISSPTNNGGWNNGMLEGANWSNWNWMTIAQAKNAVGALYNDGSMFLPQAGSRSPYGEVQMYDAVRYWSSTQGVRAGGHGGSHPGAFAYCSYFDQRGVVHMENLYEEYGSLRIEALPIRCVADRPDLGPMD